MAKIASVLSKEVDIVTSKFQKTDVIDWDSLYSADMSFTQCAVNFSSDSIPNGIGFGGRTSHFNLFISSNFDSGHTFTGATFNNPCLSKGNHIYPEVIECWGVVPKGGQQEKQDGVKGTVLERFKEDRNMLNLVGLANSSN